MNLNLEGDAVADKISDKRKWIAEEVQQWYRDTGAFIYYNSNDSNAKGTCRAHMPF